MPGHDMIVIGASAGGVEALRALVAMLPSDLPAALFVVLHIPAQATSMLPDILSRAGPLPAVHAVDEDPIQPGTIYVAPPDHHLILEDGRVCVIRGPKENRHRPAVDPLFRSAARSYGPRTVGVILTGSLDDGTAGLAAIKQRGGIAVVQDPSEAIYPGMPRSALANVAVDFCLPLEAISPLLVRLAQEPAPDSALYPVPAIMNNEVQVAELEAGMMHSDEIPGMPSVFACPECHGTLWELRDGNLIRFRCRVGHAFSMESMVAEHDESLEDGLWAALRALEESAALSRRLAAHARERQHTHLIPRFEEKAAEQDRHAATLREILRTNSKTGEVV